MDHVLVSAHPLLINGWSFILQLCCLIFSGETLYRNMFCKLHSKIFYQRAIIFLSGIQQWFLKTKSKVPLRKPSGMMLLLYL